MVMIPYVTSLAWTGFLGVGENAVGAGVFAPDVSSDAGMPGEGAPWDGSGGGTPDVGAPGDENGGRTPGADAPGGESGEAGMMSGIPGAGEKFVVSDRDGREVKISLEDFLTGALAAQIPADYGEETLKAQAVLARTWIYGLMNGRTEINEEELDMDVRTRAQMETAWGDDFAVYYGKIRQAVRDTAGEALTYEGVCITPFFCRAAAGKTRDGGAEYPYLFQAESPGDLEVKNFFQAFSFTPAEAAKIVNAIPDAVPVSEKDLPSKIQIVERDGAGYVLKLQIGGKTYSGETVQYAFGLPSACYSFEEQDGKLRILCKGIGHGYGFSQAGASVLEQEGNGYRELLFHYFQNVEITDFP